MSVIAKDTGRGDILLHRGSDERIGVRWQVQDPESHLWQVKYLSAWQATFSMSLPDGRQVYSTTCTTTSNGLAIAQIPGTAFEDGIWVGRPSGSWRIDATGPQGERELLGWGNWRLEN